MKISRSLVTSKINAAVLHFLITVVVAICSGILVFQVWFPGRLSQMLGGIDLYILVLSVEVTLGPLMSLVIFNPSKPRSELVRDYVIVGVIQLSALIYGLSVVSQSRPVFLVFVKDRIEVVSSFEMDDVDLAEAKDKRFSKKGWFGPVEICSQFPADPQERSDLLFSAVDGKDIQMFPKYYRECTDGELIARSFSKDLLLSETVRANNPDFDFTVLPEEDFVWLPVKHRFGAWVRVYPNKSDESFLYFPLEPWQ
ncbi:hypothetical protein MAH1_07080 [Sessilibacter sp. MAH1]